MIAILIPGSLRGCGWCARVSAEGTLCRAAGSSKAPAVKGINAAEHGGAAGRTAHVFPRRRSGQIRLVLPRRGVARPWGNVMRRRAAPGWNQAGVDLLAGSHFRLTVLFINICRRPARCSIKTSKGKG